MTLRAFLPALGASLLYTLGGPGETVDFRPQAGSSLTKVFTIGGEFTLDEISMIVDGQDIGGMLGQFDLRVKQESRIEIADSYRSVAQGRPTELLRTFEELSGTLDMEMSAAPTEMPSVSSSSELEGKTVAFRWNEEQQAYERSFHESSGDEEWLEDLEEDMDLRVFLPAGEVSVDDTWTIELEGLQCLVMPGGNLRMLPEDAEVDAAELAAFEELFGGFGAELGDLLEGTCECTYEGTRDEGGTRVAEIAIALEVASTLDLSEILEKAIRVALDQNEVGDVGISLETADLNLDFEGAATLLWDVKAGRLHSFQLSGDTTLDLDFAISVEAEGEEHRMDASLELSGTLRQEVSARE